MRKVILTSSLLLSLIGMFAIPVANAGSLNNMSNININNSGSNVNVPGIKINRTNSYRANRNNGDNSAGEPNYPQNAPPPGSMGEGSGASSGGLTGSKPISIPSAVPEPQSIQLPQSMNDVEDVAKTKRSQGQVPIEPPKIVQGSLQSWNTSTINELESVGRERAEKNYKDFRAGQR